jgi:hypothetical protein
MAYGGRRSSAAETNVVAFPDLKAGMRRDLLGKEIGTQFDLTQRLFAYYGEGDVFDYGEWSSRDMKSMFSRDGLASAIELVLTLPIREADYMITPAKNDHGEAELAHSVLMTPDQNGGMKTSAQELVGQITSGQLYRRAFFEKVWKIRDSDGAVIYDKIAFRPSATCQARYNDRTGAPNGFRQQVWLFGGNLMLTRNQKVPGYVDIPKIRSYIYTHGKHREPLTGVSEVEVAYWCYQTKMKLLYLWYHFLENQSLPRVVVYGNDPNEANAKADDIAQLKSSGVVGMVHPETGQKTFEEIGQGQGDAGKFFGDALSFLGQWQIGSVLAGFMGLAGASTGSHGSYALSQDQSSFYLKSRQGVSKEIADSITQDIIRPLIVLNFGTSAAFPSWKFGPLQDEQIQALLTMFQTLAAAPALNIPVSVLDLITERMATILQLDVDQVHDALMSTANQRAEKLAGAPPPGMSPDQASSLGQLQGLAQGATGLIQQAAARGQAPGQANGAPLMPGRQPPSPQPPAPFPGPPGLGGSPGGARPPSKPPSTPPPGRMA